MIKAYKHTTKYADILQTDWHPVPFHLWGSDYLGEGAITVAAVAGNGIIEFEEQGAGNFNITGDYTGELINGDQISATINGTLYTTNLQGDNTWTLVVSGSDLMAVSNFLVYLTGEDHVGNTITDIKSVAYTLETAPVVTSPLPFHTLGAWPEGGTATIHSLNSGSELSDGDWNVGTGNACNIQSTGGSSVKMYFRFSVSRAPVNATRAVIRWHHVPTNVSDGIAGMTFQTKTGSVWTTRSSKNFGGGNAGVMSGVISMTVDISSYAHQIEKIRMIVQKYVGEGHNQVLFREVTIY